MMIQAKKRFGHWCIIFTTSLTRIIKFVEICVKAAKAPGDLGVDITSTQADVLKEFGGDLNTQQQEKLLKEAEKMMDIKTQK